MLADRMFKAQLGHARLYNLYLLLDFELKHMIYVFHIGVFIFQFYLKPQ